MKNAALSEEQLEQARILLTWSRSLGEVGTSAPVKGQKAQPASA